MHYTPTYSSWINQVERWFAYLTEDLRRALTIAPSRRLRRTSALGSLRGTRTHKPFIWTKTAEQILDSLDDFFNDLTAEDTRSYRRVEAGRCLARGHCVSSPSRHSVL